MNTFNSLRLPGLRPWRLGGITALLLVLAACFAHLAAAQSVKEAVTFSAQWQVHLQQDGKGSDSRGA
ncbi:MAG: hypothetical protein B7X43_03575, partial [Thiomonas sp. 15-63-373]